MAGSVMLAGNSTLHWAREGEKVYIDTNGFPAKFRALEIDTESHKKWESLKDIGVSYVDLRYLPERSYGDERYYDQFNLIFQRTGNDEATLYTMKLAPVENDYKIMMGNRNEIQDMQVNWLEISREDTTTASKILSTIQKIVDPRLATP